jgi:four helix bundle protein
MGQLKRAVVSIEANIVEGFALRTRPLFRRHIRIALGSAVESERLLAICAELGYLPQDRVKPLLAVADRTIGLLYGLLASLGTR